MTQQLPSKVKLRKKVDVWPLRFTLGADYDVERKGARSAPPRAPPQP